MPSEISLIGACTLHDDGCVVCSDAGIPMRIVELCGDDARCVDAAGVEATIALDLVGPVKLGDVLLTHGGVAIGAALAAGSTDEEPLDGTPSVEETRA